MLIRLSIPENIIEWDKLEDLKFVFGNRIQNYFTKRQYDYIYSTSADIDVNEEHILTLMGIGYKVIFINDTMEIK